LTNAAARRANTSTRRRFDRAAEIVVGGLPRRTLMRDRDAVLDQAIHEITAILGDALVGLLFPGPAIRHVDFPETESPHVTAG
jgi:hypothetical protein